MASFATIKLIDEQRRRYAVQKVLESPLDMVVDIREPTRNAEQNRKLHAMIGDIIKAAPGGRVDSIEAWKRAIMQSFNEEMGRDPETGFDLDGKPFTVNPHSTSALSKRVFAELVEFIYAWFAPFEIQWSEPYRG
jgi:NinB protein